MCRAAPSTTGIVAMPRRVTTAWRIGSPSGRKQFHTLEIQVGRFMREIPIPVRVDHSKVTASYNNGMLEVRIRKIKPSKDIRRVEID